MAQTTAVEFHRRFRKFQRKARSGPVEITRYGRREFVLVSAEHCDWLLAAARRSHRTEDASPVVVEAVRNASLAS